MKKLSILFAIFVSSLALAVCSCAKKANDGGGKDNLPEISDLIIYENDVEAVLGDVLAIRATDGKNSVKCSWKSSDESIATVDEWGNVTAENVGKATITAAYGKLSATCAVNVTLGGNLPSIETDADDNVTVDLMHEVGVGGEIRFNGKTVDGGKVTYTVADEEIGKIEDGVFKPLKKGETIVTVTGEWKNLQSPFMSKEITVKVIDHVSLLFNDEVAPEKIELYTTGEFEGETYDNEKILNPSLKVNGEEKTISIAVEDSGIADYDAASGKITALKSGKTTLNVTSGDGVDFNQSFEISVTVPYAEYEGKTEFSILKGYVETIDGENLFNRLFPDGIISATQNGEPLQVVNGLITGAKGNKGSGVAGVITAENGRYGYKFNANIAALFVKTPEDLLAMQLTDTKKTIEGYVVLKNDIDMTNLDINGDGRTGATGDYPMYDTFYPYYSLSGKGSTTMLDGTGFAGTFDGNGHKINNFHAGNSYGFFGSMNGAIVKNVAFTNVDIYKQGMIGTVFALKASNVNMNGVYVSISVPDVGSDDYNRKSFCSLFGCADYVNIFLTDFILEYGDTFDGQATGGVGQAVGVFAKCDYTTWYHNRPSDAGYLMKHSIKNFYLIAKPATKNGRILPIMQHTSATIYASNDFADIAEGAKVGLNATSFNPYKENDAYASGNMTVYHWANAYRYDNYEQMKEKTTKVGNWDITSGAPVWTE